MSKINLIDPSEMKVGDLILSIDLSDAEALETVECIDGTRFWFKSAVFYKDEETKEDLASLYSYYKEFYLVRRDDVS